MSDIDHNHVLHLQASDMPGSVLVPVQLTGTENYGLWSRSMKIALLGKGKLGFINGKCLKESYAELTDQWEKCDAIVHSWIMNSVRKDLLNNIVYGSSAHAVWDDLQERFNKLKELWDEYDMLVPSPSCGCPKSKDYVQHLQDQRVLQFLNGLNESYDQTRRQILLKSAAPTINRVYAMIIEDEGERSMSVHNVTDGNRGREPLAMQAGSARGPSHHKPPLVCDHCHMKGHTKSQCWKIIGYPRDKGKKKQGGFRGQPFANANNVVGSSAMNTGTCLGCRCSFRKEDRCPRDLVMQLTANDHISLKNNTSSLLTYLTKMQRSNMQT
ncbi:hypothetical protein MTR67_002782 [Solanum verrucosum]|uniref:Retrotransposon Copia-like N-terminal domain-containing protein n=1 Tax=Solanum verrucosum TaxID=315347 RepID=A0AAF0T695_SOLVR|nr:hypothetical protein MTR67_002782 [Solanum verrucosum]